MPTILTYTPLSAPQRSSTPGPGRTLTHECRDSDGTVHRQRMPLGSVRGVFYLDALCLHCGAHMVWVDEDVPEAEPWQDAGEHTRSRRRTSGRGPRRQPERKRAEAGEDDDREEEAG